MNSSTVTLNSNTVSHSTAFAAVQPTTAAPFGRTLARKWDMIGVIALMLSSATYGVYALTCLTGF